MSIGLIGRKIGMSQIFDEDGNVIPITVIEAGPCYVLDERSVEKHGYSSIQLGFMDAFKKVNKPQKGYFDKIKVFPKKIIKEFQLDKGEEYQIGDQVKVDIFKQGDYVDVVGTTKGRGFQGSIKRHNMHRGPMSHGSHYHRSSGAMGGCADPAKVFKGKKLPGRMGGVRRTLQNLKIVDVNVDDNIILVKGSIPGANNNIIYINKAVKKKSTN
jgi:large subunit ribosomal protein L3